MSTASQNIAACSAEEITAYLDGELDAQSRVRLEEHLNVCESCGLELETRRQLLLELDVALADEASVEMPTNFAQIVAIRAQADLSGVRERRECKRALRLCAALSMLAIALLGSAAVSESVLAPLRALWRGGAALINFLGHALYDAGAGLAVITRGIGGHLVFESRATSIFVLLLFVSSLYMLRRLIAKYHRTQITE
jgi:predicted anti-sigma-YlaC factor YlaD